jgi:hypothetical protein
MRPDGTTIITQNKDLLGAGLVVGLILLVPLLAMRFTDEVVWGLADFVVAGALLTGTGLAFVLAARKTGSIAYRIAIAVALTAALLLVWIELAVGLVFGIGS